MTVAAGVEGAIKVGLGQGRLGKLGLDSLVEHGDDRSDDFEMAQLLSGDVEKHVLAARIIFGQCLREVAHGCGQLAIGAAKLFEQKGSQRGIGFADAHGVLKPLVVHEHIILLVD